MNRGAQTTCNVCSLWLLGALIPRRPPALGVTSRRGQGLLSTARPSPLSKAAVVCWSPVLLLVSWPQLQAQTCGLRFPRSLNQRSPHPRSL